MNYTILQQNIMLQHQFTDDRTSRAFLWACDRPDADRMLVTAEAYAFEVYDLVTAVDPMLTIAAKSFAADWSDDKHEDLMGFMLKRHLHWRFPDAKTDWL